MSQLFQSVHPLLLFFILISPYSLLIFYFSLAVHPFLSFVSHFIFLSPPPPPFFHLNCTCPSSTSLYGLSSVVIISFRSIYSHIFIFICESSFIQLRLPAKCESQSSCLNVFVLRQATLTVISDTTAIMLEWT